MANQENIRPAEQLDLDRLDPWLKSNLDDLSGLPNVTQYSGGASNWTYRLEYPQRDLVLRRAPSGTKAKGAHDMGREYRLQKALKPVYPYVPEMLAHCDDENVLGSEFYVMQRLDGCVTDLFKHGCSPGIAAYCRLLGQKNLPACKL